jgi:AcrR family transcriptional regulator
MSVDALMSRTGHTRTVFYRHFDDVPALILALIEELGAELVEVAEEWAQTERVTAAEARSRLSHFVDFYVRYGPLVHAVAEAAHHDEVVEQAYSTMVDGFIELTTNVIHARIGSGDLAPIDAQEVGRALVRMMNAYLDDVLGREGGHDPERVLDAIATIWGRTLFPGDPDA